MNMVDLARQVADTTLRSKDTQKRLWLKIAEHVIKKHESMCGMVTPHVTHSQLLMHDSVPTLGQWSC